jgi:hypothetical protein
VEHLRDLRVKALLVIENPENTGKLPGEENYSRASVTFGIAV